MNAILPIMPVPLLELRAASWANGYPPVALCAWDSDPTRSPGKRPLGANWQLRARQMPPEAAWREPISIAPNTGILCDGLRVIDVDVEDRELAARILERAEHHFGPTIGRTRPNSSKFLLLYQAAEGSPRKITLAGTDGHKVEILGYGQQFVAFGRHHTGVDIEWPYGSPLDVPRADLLPVTEDQVAAFLADVGPLIGATEPASTAHDGDVSAHGLDAEFSDIAAAVAVIPNSGPPDWEKWIKTGMAIFGATDGEGFELFRAWSARHDDFDPAACEERWHHWTHSSPPTRIGAGTLFRLAQDANPDWRIPSKLHTGDELTALPPMVVTPLRIWGADECGVDAGLRYQTKGLLSLNQMGFIVGHPGCGKSIFAPYWAYRVAQGNPFFGLKTRQCRALYLAAEDAAGMRQRIRALRIHYGPAPDFGMAELGNLTDPSAAAQVRETVAQWQPGLIMIDTLPAAWAGVDENTSQDAGHILAFAKSLIGPACSLMFVHHPAKNSDGTLPRGHGSLTGNPDLVIPLARADEDGIIRALPLPKNRNGAPLIDMAFRFSADLIGEDEDGDNITAPRAIEMTNKAGDRKKSLPKGAKRLLALLQGMGGAVLLTDLRAQFIDQQLGGSAEPRSQDRAFQRAYLELRDAGEVTASGGRVCATGSTPDGLAALSDHTVP